MITIEWHLLVYIGVNLFVFIWAITRDGHEGYLGSSKTWAFFLFILVLIISTLIYGGLFWW